MPLKKFWKRIFGNEIEFHVLKSASAVELRQYNRRVRSSSNRVNLPRYYSHYDSLQNETQRSVEDELVMIDQTTEEPGLNFSAVLISFVEATPKNDVDVRPRSVFPEFDSPINELTTIDLPSALTSCEKFRKADHFQEGMLLKCIEHGAPFPLLHYGTFICKDAMKLVQTAVTNFRQDNHDLQQQTGLFEQMYTLKKKSAPLPRQSHLPGNRYTGYILVAFKLLSKDMRMQELEETWVNWTGAREICRHSPPTWNIQRITFLKNLSPAQTNHGRSFAYVVLAEFSDIMQPVNLPMACEMVERLKARNAGHVGLYYVHTCYTPHAIKSLFSRTMPVSQSAREPIVSSDVDIFDIAPSS